MSLTDGDDRAIVAILAGATAEDAAQAGNMSARTLRRHRKDPEFERRIDSRRAGLAGELDSQLRGLAQEAVHVLRHVMRLEGPPELQLRAALGLLPIWLRSRDYDMDNRIHDLEMAERRQRELIDTLTEAQRLEVSQ
jgi:hypothetical protein